MLLRQSRTLLRHCCWCERGFSVRLQTVESHGCVLISHVVDVDSAVLLKLEFELLKSNQVASYVMKLIVLVRTCHSVCLSIVAASQGKETRDQADTYLPNSSRFIAIPVELCPYWQYRKPRRRRLPVDDIVTRADARTRGQHDYKFRSFFVATVPQRNTLPQSAVNADTVSICV